MKQVRYLNYVMIWVLMVQFNKDLGILETLSPRARFLVCSSTWL